jgi:hypothetical protein
MDDFVLKGLSVADKTIEKFLARAVRLYERQREEPFGSPQLGLYVRRWIRWVRGIAPENAPHGQNMEWSVRHHTSLNAFEIHSCVVEISPDLTDRAFRRRFGC